jgi:hypothetical protein
MRAKAHGLSSDLSKYLSEMGAVDRVVFSPTDPLGQLSEDPRGFMVALRFAGHWRVFDAGRLRDAEENEVLLLEQLPTRERS